MWASREAFLTDAGLFLLGAAGAYSLNIVGSLPGDEILLIPILPALLVAKPSRAFAREYLWFYILVAAWLLGTILGDIYRGAPEASRMKGTARVIFFACDFMALAVLINQRARRFVVFALSIVAVMLFIARYFRGEFLTQWKFGFSSSTIIVALLCSSFFYARRRYWVCLSISLALAAVNLIFAFRSQMAIILVSMVLTIPLFPEAKTRPGGQNSQARASLRTLVLLALVGGCAYAANQAIKLGVEKGLFEDNVSEKFQTQSEGKLGVLFGGRPETLVAIQAIRDSPIIGHGSFAVDQRYIELMQDIQYEYGYSDTDDPDEDKSPVIPTHSHLTMAWVESGIFGGIFWIYALVLAVKAVFRISSLRLKMAPLYCYFLVNFIWDILYSPFGSVNRIWGAYLILMSYSVLRETNSALVPARAAKPSTLHLSRPFGRRRLA